MISELQELVASLILAASIYVSILLSACSLAPKYVQPPVQVPAAYKEIASDNIKEGWKVAQPRDDVIRGKWWEMFNDPELNALEEQVNISNQNIAAAFASFLSARALVKEAQSQYFPTVTTSPAITRSRRSFGGIAGLSSNSAITDYSLPFDASWEPDLWGRIQNTVKANTAEAQATAADLENTRLTVEA